jgi:hypothetical protein
MEESRILHFDSRIIHFESRILHFNPGHLFGESRIMHCDAVGRQILCDERMRLISRSWGSPVGARDRFSSSSRDTLNLSPIGPSEVI